MRLRRSVQVIQRGIWISVLTLTSKRRPTLSSDKRGALVIFGGVSLGQGLALCAAPLLSRLYTPSDFGVFSVVACSVYILGAVAAHRWELAVTLPQKRDDAYTIVFLGILASGTTLLIGLAAVAIGGERTAQALELPRLMPWLWVVPPTSAAMGAYLVLNQLAIRNKRYAAIARRSLAHSGSTLSVQILAGLSSHTSGGLALGLAIGQGVGLMSMLPQSGLFSKPAKSARQIRHMRRLARKYCKFPLLLAPAGLLNVLGTQSPLVLIAYWYGAEAAGFLGLTQRVLTLPVLLIGNALGNVYVAKVAMAIHVSVSEVQRVFRLVTFWLLFPSIILIAVLTFLGPWLFTLVFGGLWEVSGHFARAMALSVGAQLVAVPVSQTAVMMHRQTTQFWWDASRLIATVGALALCYSLGGSVVHAVWVLALTFTASYVVSWLLSKAAISSQL